MKKVLMLLLFACVCVGPLWGQATNARGFTIMNNGGNQHFVIFDLETGDFVRINNLNWLSRTGHIPGSATLDSDKRYYIYRDDNNILVLNVDNGYLVKMFENLDNLSELHYDHTTKRIYGFASNSGDRDFGYLDIENEQFVRLQSHTFDYALCLSTLDSDSGYYILRTIDNGIVVLDINDGSLVKQFTLPEALTNFHYNQADKSIYCLSQDRTTDDYSVAVLDIDSETVSEKGKIVGADNIHLCGSAIDIIQGRMWFRDNRMGRFSVSLNGGPIRVLPDPFMDIVTHELEIDNTIGGSHEFATIRGNVFRDDNGNCLRESGEEGLRSLLIEIEPGNLTTRTNSEGDYSVVLPLGDYTVNLPDNGVWKHSCSSDPLEVRLENTGDVADGNDFALQADGNVQVLCVSVAGSVPRPGFSVHYTVYFENCGNAPFTGSLIFCHDKKLLNFESDVDPDAYDPGKAEWNLNNIPVGGVGRYRISLELPPNNNLTGQELCAQVIAELNGSGDELAGTNFDEHCSEIVNSFDPNDISVVPSGTQPGGRIAREDSILSYTIRFQNTGTAEAINVRVVDSLSDNLNFNTIRVGAVSHDYSFSIDEHGVLEWRFENINLPDSASDFAGSQGFIKYQITQKKDLPYGTVIPNRAAIYFDFNEAIITNTVENTVSSHSTSVALEALDEAVEVLSASESRSLVLKSEIPLIGTLDVFSLRGFKLFSAPLDNTRVESFRLANFPMGLYVARIKTVEGVVSRKFTFVE